MDQYASNPGFNLVTVQSTTNHTEQYQLNINTGTLLKYGRYMRLEPSRARQLVLQTLGSVRTEYRLSKRPGDGGKQKWVTAVGPLAAPSTGGLAAPRKPAPASGGVRFNPDEPEETDYIKIINKNQLQARAREALRNSLPWRYRDTIENDADISEAIARSILGESHDEMGMDDLVLTLSGGSENVVVEGAPPIRTVGVTVSCSENSVYATDDEEQVRAVFERALRFAATEYQRTLRGIASDEVLYVQSRLLVSAQNNLQYDLTTGMLPLDQMVEEFMTVLANAKISGDASNGINLDPSNVLEYEFTFVRPTHNVVTPAMVHQTNTLFRQNVRYGSQENPRLGRSILPSLIANRRFLARKKVGFRPLSRPARVAYNTYSQRADSSVRAADRRPNIEALLRLAPNLLADRDKVQKALRLQRMNAFRGRPIDRGIDRAARAPRAHISASALTGGRKVAYEKMMAAMALRRSLGVKRPSRKEAQESKQKKRKAVEDRAQVKEKARQKRMKESAKKHGIYEDLKKRIFHHGCIGDFYNYSKAVLCVPTIPEEGYCLAMAFIHAQCITYCTVTGEVTESRAKNQSFKYSLDPEINPADFDGPMKEYVECLETDLASDGYMMFPSVNPDRVDTLFQHSRTSPTFALATGGYSFFGDDNYGNISVLLFNPYKPSFTPRQLANEQPAHTLKFAKELGKDEIQAWYYAAQTFHEMVVEKSQEMFPELESDFFDANKEEILQYYSNVTQVVIAVYRTEMQGKRSRLFIPENFGIDIRSQKSVRVVSLLLSDVHADSITSLREFLKSKSSANRNGINNYCLVCESLHSANNQSAAEGKKHFLACLTKECGVLKSSCEKMHARKQVNKICPTQFFMRKKDWYCKTCMEPLSTSIDHQLSHVCQVNRPEEMKVGAEEEIYVYDFECAQESIGENRFKHRVNLVCVRSAYPNKETGEVDRALFHSLEEFMMYVMSFHKANRIYLAHNGGRYDVQFIMRHLEKNLIAHTFVPAPSSMHAYLSVTIPFGAGVSSTFLDFRNFMPGSLKGIAQSFGLSLAKGDFPHRFNDGTNEEYVGALPSLHHVNDYWCLESKRSEEEVAEFIAFHEEQQHLYCTCEEECICDKLKWNFLEQITTYCWLDVDVLAEACVRYRDNALSFGMEVDVCGWKSQGIDPFQYLTIPQLAINLLLGGMAPDSNLTITPMKYRCERVPGAIAWMERQQKPIKHAGNSNREYYCVGSDRFLDGFNFESKEVYVCLNCVFHGCSHCYYEEVETGADHPIRACTYSGANLDTEYFLQKLFNLYGGDRVHIIWEHELVDLTSYEQTLGELMEDREMFFGGRTEAFTPYINMKFKPEEELKYHDVCSLYPYVCAFKTLPTGDPEHLCGAAIDYRRLTQLDHPDPYFGFVRCTVRPRTSCLLGLLPMRCPLSGRLEFPLTQMTGTWGTQELHIAIREGYMVEDIFEVYHWEETERSDTLLRGYIAFFMQMKQEAEGWKKLGASSESPSDEEKEFIIENTFEQSGRLIRIRSEEVHKNPVKRQMSKLFLNSLWGKFCQKKQVDSFTIIHSYQQFASLWFDARNDRKGFAFRYLGGTSWKVRVRSKVEFTTSNRKYNIFLAAKVTEWARCILHERMLLIGPERILYCDTDSVMFTYPKHLPKLDGAGLGNWIDEYPGEVIQRLFAIAPKFYYLEMESEGHSLLKSKGIQMTHGNKRLITTERLGAQLMELYYPQLDSNGEVKEFSGFIGVKNMLMGVNSTNFKVGYGEMLTRYTADKKVRPVFSKRQFVFHSIDMPDSQQLKLEEIHRMFTIPHGYEKTVEDVSLLNYIHVL